MSRLLGPDIQLLLERCSQRSQVAVFTGGGATGATRRSPEMAGNPRAAHFFYTQVCDSSTSLRAARAEECCDSHLRLPCAHSCTLRLHAEVN
jgi:hypothetical protein